MERKGNNTFVARGLCIYVIFRERAHKLSFSDTHVSHVYRKGVKKTKEFEETQDRHRTTNDVCERGRRKRERTDHKKTALRR